MGQQSRHQAYERNEQDKEEGDQLASTAISEHQLKNAGYQRPQSGEKNDQEQRSAERQNRSDRRAADEKTDRDKKNQRRRENLPGIPECGGALRHVECRASDRQEQQPDGTRTGRAWQQERPREDHQGEQKKDVARHQDRDGVEVTACEREAGRPAQTGEEERGRDEQDAGEDRPEFLDRQREPLQRVARACLLE